MASSDKKGKGNYSAEDITWLEGLEAVRHRPGMYIGDVGRTGLFVLCREVLDNATDEALGGYATEIRVRLLPARSRQASDSHLAIRATRSQAALHDGLRAIPFWRCGRARKRLSACCRKLGAPP